MKTLGFKKIPLQSGAYLFHGPEMIGKKMFALELAAEFAGPEDITMITPDIDAVREMKRFFSLTPLNGVYKVAIIDDAHRLTDEAQNALLKILEEPSASSIVILVTSHMDELLPTIVSRCHQLFFPAHPRSMVMEFLKDKKLSKEQEEFLYEFSNGSIGLLAGDFSKIKSYAEEYSALAKADINKRFDMAKQLSTDESLQQKILYWMLYLHTKKLYEPLRGLLALRRTISRPQYNEQLALENFMLSL